MDATPQDPEQQDQGDSPRRGPSAFGPSALGGWRASKIEAQDSVAAFLALEAIAGDADPTLQDVREQAAVIVPEFHDDLELSWDRGRIYAQVKTSKVSPAMLSSIVAKYEAILSDKTENGNIVRFRIVALGGVADTLNELADSLTQLQAMVPIRTGPERKVLVADFVERWSIPEPVALRLAIDQREMKRDSPLAHHHFAALLRQALPVHDFTDVRVDQLYEQLAGDVFAHARRNRLPVPLWDVYQRMLSQFLPDHVARSQSAFVRTDFGYIKDDVLRKELLAERQVVRKAQRRAYGSWRRHVWRDAIQDVLYRGAIRCPACEHPLLANFAGLFGGLACPDCGYFPYLTLVYICDCSDLVVLERQPDVDRIQFLASAVSRLRDPNLKCDACGRKPEFEKLSTRLGLLPITIPVTEYSPRKLIELRERIAAARETRD